MRNILRQVLQNRKNVCWSIVLEGALSHTLRLIFSACNRVSKSHWYTLWLPIVHFGSWLFLSSFASSFEGKTRNHAVTHIDIKIVIVIKIIVSIINAFHQRECKM